jgi:uncharacterized SAM-binding protein YcdF (DUF218 family)
VWLARAGILFLLFALIRYPWSLTALARFLTLSEPPARADLILVLGGEFWGSRPLLGADLAVRGYAKKVLISGAPYNGQPESGLSVRFLVEKGYPRETFISFPITAASTTEEAIAVCPELHRLGASKVLLVTSAYHSRRANLVFRLFCPGVSFRSVAATDDQFEVENWWKTERFRRTFFSEWQKIIGTVLWKYPQHQLARLWATPIARRNPE